MSLTTKSNLGDYFREMSPSRRRILAGLALAVALAILADTYDDFWVEHAFLAGLGSGGVLLLATVLLVEEYLEFRERRKWEPVAAFALEDLGRVSREVWLNISSFAVPHLQENAHITAYRLRIESPDGHHELQASLKDMLAQRHQRQALHARLEALGGRTQQLVVRWAAVVVGSEQLAERLSEFSDVHRQIVQLLRVLSIEQGGLELPATPDELADRVLAINDKALELDRELWAEAAAISPLESAVDLR